MTHVTHEAYVTYLAHLTHEVHVTHLARPSKALLALGVIAFCGFVAEGTVNDWSAVDLTRSDGAAPPVASLGYFAFSVSMIAVRLIADRIAARAGPTRLARAAALTTVAGFAPATSRPATSRLASTSHHGPYPCQTSSVPEAPRLAGPRVPGAAGDLRALIQRPGPGGPLLPGVVLVDGAGDGTADGWGGWPAAIAGCGAVVLAHDKPGCGGSPGDWRDQTLEDRAVETLAAAEVLRGQPGVDPRRVGLLGISQGGWVAYLAASLAPDRISQLVSVAGPGVSPADQERYRIAQATGGDEEALAWVDERAQRIAAGEDPASILAAQRAYAGRPWFTGACEHYDDPGFLRFAARNFGFDPAAVLPQVRCRVFAAFGGADASVPVAPSVANLSRLLPASPQHALAVFPGGDHNLFITGRNDSLPLDGQLAPGFMPMLDAWLNAA